MLDIIARGTKSVARLRPFRLCLCASLGVVSFASTASARERSFALEWAAPAECPDAPSVETYVEEDVGAIAFGPTVVRARGSVAPNSDGRYTVELELDTGGAQPSKRQLVGGSCEAVSQAAALLVALAIRAQAVPAAAQPSPPPPLPLPPKLPAPTHERPYLAAEVLTDLGSLPVPTVGLSVAGGATVAGFRFEPSVAYFAPQSGSVSGDATLGAHFWLGSATFRVCAPFPRSRLWLAPCLGGGADWIRATGFGARVPRDPSTLDAIATAAAMGGLDISPVVSLRLELGAVLPLGRPRFQLEQADGATDVYQRAHLALRGAFGLELHF
jgi:hypothetical protein